MGCPGVGEVVVGGDTVQRRVFLKDPGRPVEEPAGMDRKRVIGGDRCVQVKEGTKPELFKRLISPQPPYKHM